MLARIKKTLWTVVAVSVVAGGLYLLWFGYRVLHPGDEVYAVTPGTSLNEFAHSLQSRGLIPYDKPLVVWAYVKGLSRSLKAGEYRFKDGINVLALLDQVTSGRVISYPFAIVEGLTIKQTLETLGRSPKLQHSLAEVPWEKLLEHLGVSDYDYPEGLFFPDTYTYSAGVQDTVLLHQAYKRMKEFVEQEWLGRDEGLLLKDPYETLILASIVEKETGIAAERPLIAGVFHNRLKRGMKLQTDPTVIYGLGERFKGNLKRKHLREDNPYNTYTRVGLPPTPIATPSAAAIRAVLHPQETQALYFVARGDGSHQFSETLREHNNAVIRFQLGGKRKAFSSMPKKASKEASSEKSAAKARRR
ncbi:MAG: endolytic transglycosylase MltG [Gammaproteobacteria bacterium]|nr:endolytic transglycosylase MltG [Gammaproteobacteria bacterium]